MENGLSRWKFLSNTGLMLFSLIQKYHPAALPYLAPVLSPMLAHCKLIKEQNPEAKTVFIGPCISKKEEAELYDYCDAVLTFEELEAWMDEKDITPAGESTVDAGHKRARFFPIKGGVIESMYTENTGFTYIAVDGAENCIEALKEIEAGNVTGPDLLTAGVGMKGSNGSGYIGAPHSGVEEFRRTARANVSKGVNVLKIFTTPGLFSVNQGFVPSFLSAEEIRTVVEEGERLHLPVAAHCIGGKALHDCVEQGVAVIEHAYCASQEDIELLKAHPECWVDLTTGIYLDPDREAYLSPANVAKAREGREIVRKCVGDLVKAGIHFALGTDANHGLLWKEVVYAVELGADKRTALKGVTSNAAYISRVAGKKGELSAGADADVIAVQGNPLEDPAVLEHVSFVMKKGVIYKENGVANSNCHSFQKAL